MLRLVRASVREQLVPLLQAEARNVEALALQTLPANRRGFNRGLRVVTQRLWGSVEKMVVGGVEQTFLLADEQVTSFVIAGAARTDLALRPSLKLTGMGKVITDARKHVAQAHHGRRLSTRVWRNERGTFRAIQGLVDEALRKGEGPEKLARKLRRYVNPSTPGGASYAALRLARTELINAWDARTRADLAASAVVGRVWWRLSPTHRITDECDKLAVGGPYELDGLPARPHPQCMCWLDPELVEEASVPEPEPEPARPETPEERWDLHPDQRQELLATLPDLARQDLHISSGLSQREVWLRWHDVPTWEQWKGFSLAERRARVAKLPATLPRELSKVRKRRAVYEIWALWQARGDDTSTWPGLLKDLTERAKAAQPKGRLKGMTGAREFESTSEAKGYFQRAYSPVLEDLPASQRRAVVQYTGSNYYEMNEALRERWRPYSEAATWVKEEVGHLDKALQVKGVPEDVIVWRGVSSDSFDVPLAKLPGTVQRDKGYMSTSVARATAFRSGDVMLKIRVPAEYAALYVDPISMHHGENELLLIHGTRFHVHTAAPPPEGYGHWLVEAEVLP